MLKKLQLVIVIITIYVLLTCMLFYRKSGLRNKHLMRMRLKEAIGEPIFSKYRKITNRNKTAAAIANKRKFDEEIKNTDIQKNTYQATK